MSLADFINSAVAYARRALYSAQQRTSAADSQTTTPLQYSGPTRARTIDFDQLPFKDKFWLDYDERTALEAIHALSGVKREVDGIETGYINTNRLETCLVDAKTQIDELRRSGVDVAPLQREYDYLRGIYVHSPVSSGSRFRPRWI